MQYTWWKIVLGGACGGLKDKNTLKTKYNMTDAEIADVRAGNITDDILDKTYNVLHQ